MKHKTWIICLVALLMWAPAVGQAQAGTAPETPREALPPAYESLLWQYHAMLWEGSQTAELTQGQTGVWERAMGLTPQQALEQIGFLVLDLNGDMVPELVIGEAALPQDDPVPAGLLFAVYTLADQQPRLVLEGWARNRYYSLGQGRFFHQGSAGAMHSAFGVFALSPQGPGLVCEEFYFTGEQQGSQELALYRNTTGQWDPAQSSGFALGEPAFWRLEEELLSQVQPLALTPFWQLAPVGAGGEEGPASAGHQAGGFLQDGADSPVGLGPQGQTGDSDLTASFPVLAHFEEDAPQSPQMPLAFALPSDSPTARVQFTALRTVRDFRLLSLVLGDVSEQGQVSFTTQVLLALPVLTPQQAVLAELPFDGDLPAFGISFIDEKGQSPIYAVEISGKDGALLLTEL